MRLFAQRRVGNFHPLSVLLIFFLGFAYAQAWAATNQPPTVATPAAANPNPVTGNTAAMSVLGADDAGEAALIYTWATTGSPPAAVTFSPNGTNAAKNSTATFTKAGAYSIQATIKDAKGLTVTSSVNVTVNAMFTSITVSPASASVAAGGTQTFTATGKDQFGTALVSQPSFTWTVTGGGTIGSTSGIFTAGAVAGGPFTVTAASGAKSGTASVSVFINAPPTVATAASATPNPVTATTTSLSVLGADDGGEAALTYSWATTGSPPAAVTFSANNTNAAKNSTASFSKAGSYSFTVTIKDSSNATVTSSVNVTVNQTTTTVVITPASAVVNPSGTQQFAASANDQFGQAMASQPSFTWTLTGSNGGIGSTTGLFTANTTTGTSTVTATGGGKSGNASVRVNAAPTIATIANATPNPATGTTTTLSVLGADDGTEANLTYMWATTGTPPAPVIFSANGTNAAKSSVATFSKAGAYSFQVTVTDAQGRTVTSSKSVTVNQTTATVVVTPSSWVVNPSGTKQFTASGSDQFGLVMAPQPSFSWTVTGGGTIGSSSGLFTANSTTGTFTVTATGGGKSGNASVRVNAAPTVQTAASASPNPVTTGTTTNLSVLGADDAGEANLNYTWSTTGSPPAPVNFSVNGTNAAKNCVATFTKSGTYAFQVTIADADGRGTSSSIASVVVNQTFTSILVTPSSASVHTRATQQFTASAKDQFGNAITSQPSMTWSLTGGGSISASGLFTANSSAGGPFTVTATGGGKSGNSSVTTVNDPPTIFNPAFATPAIVDDYTTRLDVWAGDDTGPITYSWITTGTPPAPVVYSPNNTVQNPTVTFTTDGVYTFQVTIRDPEGLTVTDVVNVTVNKTFGGTVSANTTIGPGVYKVTSNIDINSGVTLTVLPGTTLKFSNNWLSVSGSLSALGTQSQSVIFTSLQDDTNGGDTNHDGLSMGSAGDWKGILTGTGGIVHLAYCQVLWSGGPFFANGGQADAAINGRDVTTLDVQNCTISDSGAYGIFVGNISGNPAAKTYTLKNNLIKSSALQGISIVNEDNASITLTGNSFQDNVGAALYIPAYIDFRSNIFLGTNGLGNTVRLQSTISQDVTWGNPIGSTGIYLENSPSVPAGKTLTIVPGTILKLSGNLGVAGAIVAQGTSTNPIIFTSPLDTDPNVGGAIPGIGGTLAPGNWGSVSCSGAAQLSYCTFRYGGAGSGMITANTASLIELKNCVFDRSAVWGARVIPPTSGGSFTISDTVFSNCGNNGLDIPSGLNSMTTLFGRITSQSNGGYGVYLPFGTATMVNCNVSGNTAGGASTSNGALDMRASWWGHSSGPNAGAGTGSGQAITGDVLYNPWRTALRPDVPLIRDARLDADTFGPGDANTTGQVQAFAQFDAASNWTLTILNGATTVRTFSGNGASIAQAWDGKDANGNVVANGKYTMNWSATSIAQPARSEQLTGFVTVRSQSAVAIINAPAQNQSIHAGDALTINYTVKASQGGDSITSYDLAYGFGSEPLSFTNLTGFPASYSSGVTGASTVFAVPVNAASNLTLRLRALAGAAVSKESRIVLVYSGIVNNPPSVATAANSSANPVTTASTTLNVLGADDGGEANLIYSWQTTGTPPATVQFSPNGSNAAKTTTATFSAPGNYSFQVTIRDAGNLTATSTVSVTVNLTIATINVSPASTPVSISHSRQFAATALDQFGVALSPQPTFTWNTTGGGNIGSSGLFLAGATPGGPFTVTASAAGKTGTATVSVTNNPPVITTAAGATPNPTGGISTTLSVAASDDDGEGTLTYFWQTTGTPPAAVTFTPNGSNAAKSSSASFSSVGSYDLQVTVTNSRSLNTISSFTMNVVASQASISVSPANAAISVVSSRQYTAIAKDQFGAPLAQQPTFNWSVNGGGTITATGLLTADAATGGPFVVTASSGVNGNGSFIVTSDSAIYTPEPFDANLYSSNVDYRADYLAGVEPGRVYQSAEGATGVPQLRPTGSRQLAATGGGQVTLTVVSAANSPVSFYCTGAGSFTQNSKNAITVQSDAQGQASVTFSAPSTGRIPILVASPLATGQVRFLIQVGQ
jgi:hypothetical protein